MYRGIAMSWGVSGVHDWGVYGMNLAIQIIRSNRGIPLLLGGAGFDTMPQEVANELLPYFRKSEELKAHFLDLPEGRRHVLKDTCMLHALGNGFMRNDISNKFEAKHNVGFVVFERPNLDMAEVGLGNKFDMMIATSSWNASVMRDAGVENVHTCLQGVDTNHFRPMPRAGHFGDRFAVYAGGQLEFRKGQDIVLAAFRRFRERHDDAILVTSWHNPWPQTVVGMAAAGHVSGTPEIDDDGALKIAEWASANGLPEGAFADLGPVNLVSLPTYLAEMDIAIFPSRCEGGTNLIAAETMSCGVPCILSANTGHLDLIGDDNCYPMRDQGKIRSPGGESEGWGETSVDEIVEALEQAYTDRDDAKARGARAAEGMAKNWSVETKSSQLLDVLERELPA